MTDSVLRRSVAVALHIGLFVGFGACNHMVARWCATRQSDTPKPTCLGPEDASRHVVYLHGLDSRAPSWQELDNRHTGR